MTQEQLERVAKDWYTGQRGRVVGNTVAWADLDLSTKIKIINKVNDLISDMKEAWRWPGT